MLANEGENAADEEEMLDFDGNGIEFGADNYATHHICAEKSLFIGEINPLTSVGVRGINGISRAEGTGTVKFEIRDDEEKSHEITLHNVLYLPQASKNLISISQWSEERGDNCGIMSRGEGSLFLWNNDKYCKSIPHHASCKIPLIKVNETKNGASVFFQSCTEVIDSDPLFPEGIPPRTPHTNNPTDDYHEGRDADIDQQSIEVVPSSHDDKTLPLGTIVITKVDGTPRISVITDILNTITGHTGYKIRHLNENIEHEVSTNEVTTIRPEPGDIPHSVEEVG